MTDKQAFHFAAARDGQMYVSGIDAETWEAAYPLVMAMVARHFDLPAPVADKECDTECELDGFAMWAAASFEYC